MYLHYTDRISSRTLSLTISITEHKSQLVVSAPSVFPLAAAERSVGGRLFAVLRRVDGFLLLFHVVERAAHRVGSSSWRARLSCLCPPEQLIQVGHDSDWSRWIGGPV